MGIFSYPLVFRSKCCSVRFTLLALFIILCISFGTRLWFISSTFPDPMSSAAFHLRIHKLHSSTATITVTPTNVSSSFENHNIDYKCAAPLQLSLRNSHDWKRSRLQECRRSQPDPYTCNKLQDLFFKDGIPQCNSKHHQICNIQKIHLGLFRVVCSSALCTKSIELGIVSSRTGSIHWHPMNSLSMVADQINHIIHSSADITHFGFCLIRCLTQSHIIKQLLILPPKLCVPNQAFKLDQKLKANLNLIVLDSLSRSHFYRSLPTTVNVLKSIQNQNVSETVVLDFMNMQSLKPRTHESMKALFSGVVDTAKDIFLLKDLPPEPVHIENLLKPLKDKGYMSLWLEDMCWKHEWGLINDLGIPANHASIEDKWQYFQQALERAHIDHYDVSIASCEIFQDLNITNHFHKPVEVCYNGIPQQNYLLEYLWLFQNSLHQQQRPFLTVYTPNIAHEDTGRRIQMLDKAFSDYLQMLTALDTTLSVIVSDHGNNYGQYPERFFHGRLESVNPVFFMIIPARLASILDKELLTALTDNQDKLLTLQDVHATLQDFFAIQNSPYLPIQSSSLPHTAKSLLRPIPSTRTCSDLPMLQPNLCICEGLEVAVNNQSDAVLVAEFALGQLNELLNQQLKRARADSRPRCERLIGVAVTNVKEAHSKEQSVVTTFDLQVKTSGATSATETVFIAVETSLMDMPALQDLRRNTMKLQAFEHISPYSSYAQCAKGAIDIQLCICDIHSKDFMLNLTTGDYFGLKGQDFIANFIKNPPQVLQISTNVYAVDMHGRNIPQCLYVISRKHDVGAAFELASTCIGWLVRVEFTVEGRNIMTSHAMPLTVDLSAGDIKFLCIVKQLVVHLQWKWSYSLEFTMKRI